MWDKKFKCKIRCPEFALLLFRVFDDDMGRDVCVAQYSLPFMCLQNGELTGLCMRVCLDVCLVVSVFIYVCVCVCLSV